MPPSRFATRPLTAVGVDFAPEHRQPTGTRVALATAVAVAGSLAADALLVVLGEALFPSTKGYVHFGFGDYAKLTIIGVVIASLAWPVVTRLTSAPRRLFSRLAVLVTLVLLLPDVWLLHQHQSARAVAVLMVMHVAIAFVTYFALVLLAPVRAREGHRIGGQGRKFPIRPGRIPARRESPRA